jgi:hypothetical protein
VFSEFNRPCMKLDLGIHQDIRVARFGFNQVGPNGHAPTFKGSESPHKKKPLTKHTQQCVALALNHAGSASTKPGHASATPQFAYSAAHAPDIGSQASAA